MSRDRENNFGLLRLAAALMVMSGHMAHLTGTQIPSLLGEGIQVVGVQTLFLIGGYLITKSWLSDPHPLRYGVKRILRIWPPLVACVLVSMVVLGPVCTELSLKEYFASPGLPVYLYNLRLFPVYSLPGCFADNPYPVAVNGSLWTLPVEVFMYAAIALVYALLGALAPKKGKGYACGTVGLLLAVVALRCYIYRPIWGWNDRVVYGTSVTSALTLIPYYLIGSVYASLVPKKWLNLPLAVALMGAACCFQSPSGDPMISELLVMLALPYLVFSLAFASPVVRMHAWADLSYGIYLYGFPVQQTVVHFLRLGGVDLSNKMPLVLLLSVAAVLPFAFFSEFAVERPSVKICKKICSKIGK